MENSNFFVVENFVYVGEMVNNNYNNMTSTEFFFSLSKINFNYFKQERLQGGNSFIEKYKII